MKTFIESKKIEEELISIILEQPKKHLPSTTSKSLRCWERESHHAVHR